MRNREVNPKGVDELRQQALDAVRRNDPEGAVELLDRAIEMATDEETREALRVDKAGALVMLGRSSDEVQQLPSIMMRRPDLRGLAAYHLSTRFENEKDFARARFYLEIALQAAEQQNDQRLKAVALIGLGNNCVYDSSNDDAISYYEAALKFMDDTGENRWRSFVTHNLGYCKLLKDELEGGIALIQQAVEMMSVAELADYRAECFIDLCLGYLELEDLDSARRYGEMGLQMAKEIRQIRNAHYLLGEVAFKSGDSAAAETHFDELAKFYPDFPHLKNLLLAIDLRKMVNLRL
jgi:tetratricopeptide (TPR) repeat protein